MKAQVRAGERTFLLKPIEDHMSEQINVPGLLDAAPAQQPLSVHVTQHNSQVVLHFSQPREYVAMTGIEPVVIGARLMLHAVNADDTVAQEMINVAMACIDHAYEKRGDLKPAGSAVKHELIERHRRKLTKRLEVMLNSLREKKTTSNQGLAKTMVDAMLNEVFT